MAITITPTPLQVRYNDNPVEKTEFSFSSTAPNVIAWKIDLDPSTPFSIDAPNMNRTGLISGNIAFLVPSDTQIDALAPGTYSYVASIIAYSLAGSRLSREDFREFLITLEVAGSSISASELNYSWKYDSNNPNTLATKNFTITSSKAWSLTLLSSSNYFKVAKSGNLLQVTPQNYSSLPLGIYNGKIQLTNTDKSTLLITVSIVISSEGGSGGNAGGGVTELPTVKKKIGFCSDASQLVSVKSSGSNSDILDGSLMISTDLNFTLPIRIPFFKNKAEFHLGDIVAQSFPPSNILSNTDPLHGVFSPTSLAQTLLSYNLINRDGHIIQRYASISQPFLLGHDPSPPSPVKFLTNMPTVGFISRKSILVLNVYAETTSTCRIKLNNENWKTFYSSFSGVQAHYLNIGKIYPHLSEFDQISVELVVENHKRTWSLSVKRNTLEYTHLFYENEWGVPECFTVTGKLMQDESYHFTNYEYRENRKDKKRTLHNKQTRSVSVNSGYLMPSELFQLGKLLQATRWWLLVDGQMQEAICTTKKISQGNSRSNLLSNTLTFELL